MDGNMGTLRTKFRGVKKELLERQTSMLIQSMTVGILNNNVLFLDVIIQSG